MYASLFEVPLYGVATITRDKAIACSPNPIKLVLAADRISIVASPKI